MKLQEIETKMATHEAQGSPSRKGRGFLVEFKGSTKSTISSRRDFRRNTMVVNSIFNISAITPKMQWIFTKNTLVDEEI